MGHPLPYHLVCEAMVYLTRFAAAGGKSKREGERHSMSDRTRLVCGDYEVVAGSVLPFYYSLYLLFYGLTSFDCHVLT